MAGHPATVVAHRLHGRGRLRDLRGARRTRRPLWRRLHRGRAARRACSRRAWARATRCASRRRCASTATTSTRPPRLVEAGLGWIVSLDEAKGDFPGRGVLEAQKKDGPAAQAGGLRDDRAAASRATAIPSSLDDEPVGAVTSGTYAPFLQKNIGLCYLPAARAAVGHGVRRRRPRPPRAGARGAHAVLQAPERSSRRTRAAPCIPTTGATRKTTSGSGRGRPRRPSASPTTRRSSSATWSTSSCPRSGRKLEGARAASAPWSR